MTVPVLVILLVATLWSLWRAMRMIASANCLLVRYWCGDGPEGSGTLAAINADVARLPAHERQALADALGETFPITDVGLSVARPFHRHPFKGRAA